MSKTLVILGNINNFRAFMDRRLRQNLQEGVWVSSEGKQLVFAYRPKYDRDFTSKSPYNVPPGAGIVPGYAKWIVYLEDSRRHAEINSYEETPGKVHVDFLDSDTPIGPAFEEFCQWIFEEASRAGILLEQQAGDNVPGEADQLPQVAIINKKGGVFMTTQPYERLLEQVLVSQQDCTFKRESIAPNSTLYFIFQGGQEIGRIHLSFDDSLGFQPTVALTANIRGGSISWQNHQDLSHIPDHERDQTRRFMQIVRSMNFQFDFFIKEVKPPAAPKQAGNDRKVGMTVRDDAPWEQIPDHLWHRRAVKLWCEGYTAKEIGEKLNLSEGRIRNCITELRRDYPKVSIPYHQRPKKT